MQGVLRIAGRILRQGIPLGLLAAAMLVYFSQNFTTVSRQGDFALATSELMSDQFPRHVASGEPPHRVIGTIPHFGAAGPIAKRYQLKKQAGLVCGSRGHSVSFVCEFPEFSGDSTFLKVLNKQLRQECEQAAAEFTLVDWSSVYDGWKEPQSYLVNWEASIDLDILHASDVAVSLLESRYEYTGGAHGNMVLVGRCFVDDGGRVRQLRLEDLFAADSPWEKRLVEFCLNDLRQQGASGVPPEAVDDPFLEWFSTEALLSFTLSSDELTFYFSPYHVGCYAEGAYTVNVPYADIRDLMPDDSPASKFMSSSPLK